MGGSRSLSISEQSNPDNDYNEADKAYSWGVLADGMTLWQQPIFATSADVEQLVSIECKICRLLFRKSCKCQHKVGRFSRTGRINKTS